MVIVPSLNSTTESGRRAYLSGVAISALLLAGVLAAPQPAFADDLYITTSNGIGEYSLSGAAVKPSLITGLSFPGGIVSSGYLMYVPTGNTIEEYSTGGVLVNANLISGLNSPYGITLSGSNIFVTNYGGNTLGEYTTSGAVVNASLITGLNGPVGVAVSGSDIFVANEGHGYGTTIGEYTTSGAVVNASFIAGLHGPTGIAISGSDLFVVNYLTGVVGEYDATTGAAVNASLITGLGIDNPVAITIVGSDIYIAGEDGTVREYTTSGSVVNANLISGATNGFGVATGTPPIPIDTNAPYYTSDTFSTYAVAPDFEGGTLRIVPGSTTLAYNFNVGAVAGNTIDANGNAATFSGAFTGAGGLTFTDSSGNGSTITLTGANTYTGGTTISSGTLQIGNGGATGSIVGNVVDNAALVIDRSGALTLAGVISGTGSLTQMGPGTLTLTGANTFTGGTTISGGTLQIGNGGSTGSIVGNVVDNAALIFNRSSVATFGGVISGTGSLSKMGGAGLILTGANTYSGGTTISGGILLIGNGGTTGSIVGNVTNNSTLDFYRSDAVTFGGVVSGTGYVYQGGSGTLTLTGANTYSGGTLVSSGTLTVNGSIASSSLTRVFSGATLNGVGTVGNVSVLSGGVLAPGSGVAGSAMTVTGNLTLAAGAIYQVNLNPTTASLANVSGTATLTGAGVQAVYSAGSYLSNTYTVLHTGGLGGTSFASLTAAGLPSGFVETLVYSATDVQINLALNGPNFGNSLSPVNAQNVANAITAYFNNGGALPPSFVGLYTQSGAQLAAALGQLAGQQQGAFAQGGFEAGGAFLGMMLNPYADGRGGAIGGSGAPLAYAGDGAAQQAQRAFVAIAPAGQSAILASSGYTVWGSAFGGGGETGGDASLGAARVASSFYGVATGLDYHVMPGLTIGAAMSGGGTGFTLAQGLGSGHSDFEQIGVYGRYDEGPAYVSTALAGSVYQITTTRTGGLAGTQAASFTAPGVANRTELGYGLDAGGGVKLTPYFANQVQTLFLPSFAENGGAGSTTSLAYNARSTYDDRTEIGAWFEHVYQDLYGAKVFGRVAFAHDFTNEGVSSMSFVSLPGAGFTSYSARIAPNSALATLGAEVQLGDGWSLGGKLEGQFASSGSTLSANAVLRKSW